MSRLQDFVDSLAPQRQPSYSQPYARPQPYAQQQPYPQQPYPQTTEERTAQRPYEGPRRTTLCGDLAERDGKVELVVEEVTGATRYNVVCDQAARDLMARHPDAALRVVAIGEVTDEDPKSPNLCIETVTTTQEFLSPE